MTTITRPDRVERAARLRWVPVPKMSTSSLSQRELNQSRVDRIVANLDLEQIGAPTVNLRDGLYWIIDGQHRIEALRQIGWGDQQIQCWTYEGLTEEDEAEKFLKLNDYLAVNALAKFRVSVQAGRDTECDIDRIVRALGLVVSADKVPGGIGAVGTLRRVYDRAGAAVLRQTLSLVRDTYGDPGLEASVIDGVGLFVHRYGNETDLGYVAQRLKNAHGGSHGLLGKAEIIRRATGNQKNHCVAAAVVEIVNASRGGKRITSWWRDSAPTAASVSA